MNRPLRKVAVACLVLFGLLLVNVNVRQTVLADGYRDNERNSRVLIRNYERERGSIALAGPGRPVIAQSVETSGRLKYLRTYPTKELFAHVTGYYSLIYGQDGLEDTRDRVLSGEDPQLFVSRLSDTLTGQEPRGGDVVITLLQAAQQAAVTGLAGKRGAVVALDPATGAILAMASAPTYDPNQLSSFDPAAIRAYRERLTADGSGDPLLNRAVSQTYPPGSTFKVITAAAALQDGVRPQSRIPSPTVLDLPQTNVGLRNFGGETCGDGSTTTLADAMRISCNTAFAQLGLSLGQERLREQAEAFGFGDTGLTVPERVAPSVVPPELDPPSLAQSAIGQRDVRVTPLQMAMVAAGVANGGDRHEAVPGARGAGTRPEPAVGRAARGLPAGGAGRCRRRAAGDDGECRHERHRHVGADPGRPGGRQDRYGAARARCRPARLVHRLRARRQPQGGRGGGRRAGR